MHENLAWTKLIAYILTDGSIKKEGDDGLYLVFYNKDQNLLSDFQKTLNEFDLSSTITQHENNFQVRKGCKQLATKLMEICKIPIKDGRVKKQAAEIPSFILEDKELIKLFLKVVASAEGYVKFTKNKNGGYARRITLGSTNERFKNFYMHMLEQIGIESRMAKNEIKIYGFDNFLKFKDEIGFIDGCRVVRGPKKGMFKKDLLDSMISSFSDGQRERSRANKSLVKSGS